MRPAAAALKPRYPGVNFVGVVSGANEDRVRSLVADHHWTFPVAIDRNLAVFNTYRVSLCATSVFAYRGGIVRTSKVEAQRYTGAQLERGDPRDGAALIDEPELIRGFVDATLSAEFPDLGLVYSEVAVTARSQPSRRCARGCAQASDRFTGAKAVALRQQPIPWAYRVFFRHVGIDPDERRTPIEAIALERMRAGGFQSQNLVDDALLLATLETGVPVLAFDAAAVEGRARPARVAGRRAARRACPLSAGQVVVADAERALAVLFGEVREGCAVQRTSTRMLVAAVRVKGVPEVSVEEALWVAAETVSNAD